MRWRWGGWIEKVKSQVNFKNRTAETMMEGLFHVVIMCMTGKTAEDRDATAIVLLLPFGLYLIFTKKICIYG